MKLTKLVESVLKKCYLSLSACTLALVLTCSTVAPAAFADVRKADVVYGQTVDVRGLAVAQCPNIDAEYAIVMDADGTVYYERNASNPIQIASITKIMTGIVALDAIEKGYLSFDDTVEVSAAAAEVGESSAGLIEGDTISLEIALSALLVPSGNDAAVAIAETVGKAALDKIGVPDSLQISPDDPNAAFQVFVTLMNEKAIELGCIDTKFENPHGLDDGEFKGDQHSCAADVAKMAQYAMKNKTFRSIVGNGDTSIAVERNGSKIAIDLVSTDELIDMYEYAIGIKTGFTALAGPSFAGAANNGKKELYAAVIHSTSEAQRFSDAEELFTWTYDHIRDYALVNSKQTTPMATQGSTSEVPVVAEVAHSEWIDKTIKATTSNPEDTVQIFDLNGNISQSLDFDEVKGNVKAGEKVGTITFKQRNNVIATQDLVACEDVVAPDFFQGIGIWWDRVVRGLSGQSQVSESSILNETPLINDKTASAA